AARDGGGGRSLPSVCAPDVVPPVFAARFDDPAEPEPFGFDALARLSDGGEQDFSVDPSAGRRNGGLVVVIRDGPATSHNSWLSKKVAGATSLRRVRLDFDFRVVSVAHFYAVMGALFFDPGNANGHALRAAGGTVGVGIAAAYGQDTIGRLFSDA